MKPKRTETELILTILEAALKAAEAEDNGNRHKQQRYTQIMDAAVNILKQLGVNDEPGAIRDRLLKP